MGAKSKYTEALGAAVLEGLAEGKSLRAVCREMGFSVHAVLNWIEDFPEFGEQYARTRRIAYQMLAEELVEISDEEDIKVKHPKGGGDENGEVEVVFDSAAVARNRLRVDTRKWMLSKMLPKVYGDKVSIGGIDGAPAIKTESSITITAEDAYKKMLNGGV